MSEGSTLCEGLGPLVARIGSPPDTHCWDGDSAADCWSYSPQMVAELLEAAVAAERERCAKLCEQWDATHPLRLAAEIRGPRLDGGVRPQRGKLR